MELLIGFGGNQGDVEAAFSRALRGLREEARVAACSGLWRSAPEGPPQADYLNAAALVEFGGHPLALLTICRRLEAAAGRERAGRERWRPRPLDLDLLLAPGVVISCTALELPHPRLSGRRFALAPASELAPDWVHPRALRTLAELATSPEVAAQRCDRLGRFPTS